MGAALGGDWWGWVGSPGKIAPIATSEPGECRAAKSVEKLLHYPHHWAGEVAVFSKQTFGSR